jgi:carboxyl-terminal processing protease
MKKILSILALFAIIFTSCKKDKGTDNGGGSSANTLQLLKDSIYSYAQEEYLWYDALPDAATFNTARFTGSSDLAAMQAEIDALSQIKINPTTSKPYEYDTSYPGTAKYSYIDGGQAATAIGGTGGDFGFGLTYFALDDLRIRYVYPNSSAATQGLARGYKVTAVNDQSVTLTTASNSDPAIVRINSALGGSSIKLALQRPDNTTFTVTVSKTTYTINPVIKALTLTTAGGKKVGYFAFSRFTVLNNASAAIDAAFAKFATEGISELVVDLRYNGGGAIETAQYIDDYLVPASKTGSLMFVEAFNNKLQAGNHPFLSKKFNISTGYFSAAKNTFNFSKKGSLNLNRVFFLVTGNTASASELTINNIKPVLPGGVHIIGATSYGKPVGFFGIPLGTKSEYDLYLSEIESRNSEGKADFYQGMIPGTYAPGIGAADDITHDFGDPAETMFATALYYIDKGSYPAKASLSLNAPETISLRAANQLIDAKQQFSGAIHERDLKRINP